MNNKVAASLAGAGTAVTGGTAATVMAQQGSDDFTPPIIEDKPSTPKNLEDYRVSWSSSLLASLNEPNKNVFDKLKKLHDEFKQNKDSKTKSLQEKVSKFDNCFKKFNEKVAAGWTWDWWKNVWHKLGRDSECQQQINTNRQSSNVDQDLIKTYKSEENFLSLVGIDNLESSLQSNLRSWLTSVDAEFAQFNEKVNNYKAKKQCFIDLTHKHSYFYKSWVDKCLKLKSS